MKIINVLVMLSLILLIAGCSRIEQPDVPPVPEIEQVQKIEPVVVEKMTEVGNDYVRFKELGCNYETGFAFKMDGNPINSRCVDNLFELQISNFDKSNTYEVEVVYTEPVNATTQKAAETSYMIEITESGINWK